LKPSSVANTTSSVGTAPPATVVSTTAPITSDSNSTTQQHTAQQGVQQQQQTQATSQPSTNGTSSEAKPDAQTHLIQSLIGMHTTIAPCRRTASPKQPSYALVAVRSFE
jgi:hypothetical protein